MILIVPRFLKFFAGKGIVAMALFPFILVRDMKIKENETTMNHERIHHRQQLELLIIFFYLIYGTYYLYYLMRGYTHFNAYMNIPFEREAYANEANTNYLKDRNFWEWMRY